MRKLPSDLADVVGPLHEAEDYARLQGVRQLGLYNVLTGLPGFLIIFPWWLPPLLFSPQRDSSPTWGIVSSLLTLTLFFFACFPKVFLPLVRRFRPDWQSPLLESSLLKRGLEKQFWFQFPFWMGYSVLLPVALIILVFPTWGSPAMHEGVGRAALFSFVLGFVLHVTATAVLAWQAGRTGDRALRWTFLAMMPLAVVPLVWSTGQSPSLVGMALFATALVVPPIVVGLVRLLAPRRWLVR